MLNALSLPYSNGVTEGHVNRVKLIKRSMYGRASFELLCNKIFYPAAKPNEQLAVEPWEPKIGFTKTGAKSR